MLAALFIGGLIVALTLAYKGLVTGSLQFSKSTTLTGKQAKAAGMFCLAVAAVLLAAIAWAVWMMATAR
jgi:hypothetical protein